MLLILIGIAVITYNIFTYLCRWRAYSALPGPSLAFPLLGHLPLLTTNPTTKFLEWKKKYGPVYFLRFGAFPTVVINDARLIREAFVQTEFAGRPKVKFLEATDHKGIVPAEGAVHQEQRQFALQRFRVNRKSIEDCTQEEIETFVNELKTFEGQSVQVNDMFNVSVLNGLSLVIIGKRFHKDDPKIQVFIDNIRGNLLKMNTLLSLLAIFVPSLDPWLKNFGSEARRQYFHDAFKYMDSLIDETKVDWVADAPRSVSHAYLDKIEATRNLDSSFHAQQNSQPHFMLDLFIAGMETTSVSLEWAIYYLSKHPEVQDKLNEEIDRVVGDLRLPSLQDKPQMPYTEAVINETLRFSSVIPLGVLHRTTKPVTFRGISIPENTVIMSDIYSAHFNEETWGDPHNFRPERWLEKTESSSDSEENNNSDTSKTSKSSKNSKDNLYDKLVAFGAGKRVCVGEALARDSIFLFVTKICQKFRIETPPNFVDDVKPSFGFTLSPTSFSVIFKKRDIIHH